jgi:hypothetical protein
MSTVFVVLKQPRSKKGLHRAVARLRQPGARLLLTYNSSRQSGTDDHQEARRACLRWWAVR